MAECHLQGLILHPELHLQRNSSLQETRHNWYRHIHTFNCPNLTASLFGCSCPLRLHRQPSGETQRHHSVPGQRRHNQVRAATGRKVGVPGKNPRTPQLHPVLKRRRHRRHRTERGADLQPNHLAHLPVAGIHRIKFGYDWLILFVC